MNPGSGKRRNGAKARNAEPNEEQQPQPAPREQDERARTQYLSDHFQGELRFLGIRSSPSFVAAPEGNGCAERFIRTLKEQLLWVEPFETVQQLRLALLAFKDRYNQKWLVERHGHRTPAAVRQALSPSTGAGA